MADPHAPRRIRSKQRTFRGVVLRGLTLLLPPILTIVILIWVAGTIESYVLTPIKTGLRETLAWAMADVREDPPGDDPTQKTLEIDGQPYARLESGQYVPLEVVDWLRVHQPGEPEPATGAGAYRRYVEGRYLRPQIVVPVFLCAFVLILYFLGKFLAAEIGSLFDWGILRLPLVRNVYSAVKQVTNFVFGENHLEPGRQEYKRVVAVEYPRRGLWSIGLVTGEAVLDVNSAANEPCVTVILPGSPLPVTGYAVMMPVSRTHEVNMSIDQALQFLISCGVVVPGEHAEKQAISDDR